MVRRAAIAEGDGTNAPRNVTVLEQQAARLINSRELQTFCPGDRYMIYNKHLVDVKPVLAVGVLDVTNNRQSALPRAWLQNVDLGTLPAC